MSDIRPMTREEVGMFEEIERLRELLRAADIELEEQVDDDHRDWHARQAREAALAGAAVQPEAVLPDAASADGGRQCGDGCNGCDECTDYGDSTPETVSEITP